MMRDLIKKCVVLQLMGLDPYDLEDDLKEEFNADDEEFDRAVGISEDIEDDVNRILDILIDMVVRFER